MEPYKLNIIFKAILLVLSVSLFVFIKWYFSTLSSNVRNRLRTQDIVVSALMGLVVFLVISDREASLLNRTVIFLLSVAVHVGKCLVLLKSYNKKPVLYSRSFLIFHNGKFLKGAILQNKLSQEDIMRSLQMKGVADLAQVDTIILEANGDLSIIYKKKMNATT